MQYKIVFSKELRMSNYKVNFSGIQQSEEAQNYINEVVRSLTPLVPAKSSFVLNISEIENRVTGSFKSISASSKFVSIKKADSSKKVMDLIFKDISQQVDFWLEKRVV